MLVSLYTSYLCWGRLPCLKASEQFFGRQLKPILPMEWFHFRLECPAQHFYSINIWKPILDIYVQLVPENLISECFDFCTDIHKTVLSACPFLFKSQWWCSFKNLNFANEAVDAVWNWSLSCFVADSKRTSPGKSPLAAALFDDESNWSALINGESLPTNLSK